MSLPSSVLRSSECYYYVSLGKKDDRSLSLSLSLSLSQRRFFFAFVCFVGAARFFRVGAVRVRPRSDSLAILKKIGAEMESATATAVAAELPSAS